MRKSGVSYNRRRREIWREVKQFALGLKHYKMSQVFVNRKIWDLELTTRQAYRLVVTLRTCNTKRSWSNATNKLISYPATPVRSVRVHQSLSIAAAVNSLLGSPREPVVNERLVETPAFTKLFDRDRRDKTKIVVLTSDDVKRIHVRGQRDQITLRTWLISYIVFKHGLSTDDALKIFDVMCTNPNLIISDCHHLMASSFTEVRLAALQESADYLAGLLRDCRSEARG